MILWTHVKRLLTVSEIFLLTDSFRCFLCDLCVLYLFYLSLALWKWRNACERSFRENDEDDEDEDTNWVRNRGSKFFEAEINKFPLVEKNKDIYLYENYSITMVWRVILLVARWDCVSFSMILILVVINF